MGVQEFRAFHVLLQLLHVSFQFRSAILEPRYHLCIGQSQIRGYFVAVGRTEVFLVEEPFFQLENLVIRECGPGFSFLFRLLAVVEQVEVVLAV